MLHHQVIIIVLLALFLIACFIAVATINGIYQWYDLKVGSVTTFVLVLGVPSALIQYFQTSNSAKIAIADQYVKSLLDSDVTKRVMSILENFETFCSYESVPWVRARYRQVFIHDQDLKDLPAAFEIDFDLLRIALKIDLRKTVVNVKHLAVREDFDVFIKNMARIQFYLDKTKIPLSTFEVDLRPIVSTLFTPHCLLDRDNYKHRISSQSGYFIRRLIKYYRRFFKYELGVLLKMRDYFLPDYKYLKLKFKTQPPNSLTFLMDINEYLGTTDNTSFGIECRRCWRLFKRFVTNQSKLTH